MSLRLVLDHLPEPHPGKLFGRKNRARDWNKAEEGYLPMTPNEDSDLIFPVAKNNGKMICSCPGRVAQLTKASS